MVVVALALLSATAGVSEQKEDPLATADVHAVAQQVQAQADAIGALIGAPPERQSLRTRECSGRAGERSDRVFGVRGGFHFYLDAPDLTVITATVRSAWQAAGWTISDDRELANGDTQLVGEDPASGLEVWFVGHQEEKGVNLSVYSPCFHSPDPVEFGDVDLPEPTPSGS